MSHAVAALLLLLPRLREFVQCPPFVYFVKLLVSAWVITL